LARNSASSAIGIGTSWERVLLLLKIYMASELALKKSEEAVGSPNYELRGSVNHILEEAKNLR